ncbi:MAG: 3-hydroxyacyl-CoA dehydrogenase NAD-binding domain-containing protein [Rhodobacterales bacterium]|nr:3-hydroxyacyl-CoA dehydrogenase NAD-binding domain-containing protein [Rhodobacterales bacterium]
MIQHVAIIGAGLIGASWSALFLSKGLRVTVCDPSQAALDGVPGFVATAWDDLAQLDNIPAAPPLERLTLTQDIATACRDADMVQECGPDRIGIKQQIVAQIETTLAPEALIASSTSSLMASDIQDGARHPGRILVAHPMNPPHLVPLVELVAGRATDPASITAARAFYDGIGRVTVVVQKERVGHLANRLTSALYREAVSLVAEGVATVADVDRAIAHGPGLRWAFMGPHLTYHLGGGAGGYRHYLDHLGPTQVARWADQTAPELTPSLIETLVAGIEAATQGESPDTLARRRDAALVALAKLKRELGA